MFGFKRSAPSAHASGDYPMPGKRYAVIPTSVPLRLEPHPGYQRHFMGDWGKVGHAPTPMTERAQVGCPRWLFAPPKLHVVGAGGTGEEYFSKPNPEFAHKIVRTKLKNGIPATQLVPQTAGLAVVGVTHG